MRLDLDRRECGDLRVIEVSARWTLKSTSHACLEVLDLHCALNPKPHIGFLLRRLWMTWVLPPLRQLDNS